MAAAESVNLSAADALALRMQNLLLRPGPTEHPTSVADVVTWMGAMQSQDLASGLWSFGARLPGATVSDVEAALERPEALRTWPMRGTVHFVPPRDAHWMLEVLGERPLAQAAKRREYIGLTEREADRAVDVLGKALSGGGRLTRAECTATLERAGIDGAGQLTYHMLWYASQRGVTCIAPNVGNEQTFVVLDEWVPDPVKLNRDEALATMALRYFQSHGPTTRQNFAGWMWSTAADAKLGIAGCGDALATVRVDGTEMIVAREALDAPAAEPMVDDEFVALPGFDEYLLGFKERSMVLDAEHLELVVPGKNGVFRSTIVRGGKVIATWKRTLSKQKVTVEIGPFGKLRVKDKRAIEASLEPYAQFLGRTLEVRWP